MSDIDHNDEFDEAFKGFGDTPATVVTPPAADPANPTPPAPAPAATPPAPVVEPPKPEEPKKDEQAPAEPPKSEEATPPADPAKKPEEGAEPPKAPETPPAPEAPKPLTLDDIKGVINEVRSEERTSGQALENQTKAVLDAYYPEGLSNTLVDQTTGKELKTPQDVVDVTNGEMNIEQANQWLMNEQFKLDKEVDRIKNDAKQVAETTLKFKQDSLEVMQRYEPLFKVYPFLQQKVWDSYKPLIKADEEKDVILSAPDMRQYYDTMLEPYRMAVELGQQQSATAPTDPATPPAPAPAPSAEDRLDEVGDGGQSPVNDPNDFAQQVSKELAKGE